MLEIVLAWIIGDIVGVIAHEAGHALAAYATGFQILGISIGRGNLLFGSRCRGVKIELHVFPFAGRITFLPEFKLRKAASVFFLLGGGAANFLLLIATAAIWYFRQLPEWTNALLGFGGAQLYRILMTLWPGWRPGNDGSKIAYNLKQPDGSQTPLAQFYSQSLAEYIDGRSPMSAVSPATRRLMLFLGLNQITVDRWAWEQNFSNLVEEIEKGELSKDEELLVLETLITEAVMRGARRAYLDDWSTRAMKSGAHIKTVRFSRAAALIELGRFAEGKALIEEPSALDDRPYDVVLNSIFLARAEAGLGNHKRADELLDQASARMAAEPREHQWKKEQELLDRIRKTIETEKTGVMRK